MIGALHRLRSRRVGSWLCALLAAGALSGCDSRAREIRGALPEGQVAVFDRGAQAAVDCWSCHDLYSERAKIGPGLLGIFSRPAAGLSAFAYSDAMRQSGIVWDRRSLAAYLGNPQGIVPGTTMVSRGVPDGASLAALVFYLEQITRP